MNRPSLNHFFRLVWSNVNRCWVAVAETARGRGKSGRSAVAGAVVVLAAGALPGLALAENEIIVDGGGTSDINNMVFSGTKTVGSAGSQTVYTNFFTEGGAGSGGGAGLGGVFFVNQGANLTLTNVNLMSNTAKGGEGGAPPALVLGDVYVNVAPRSLDLISLDTQMVRPTISRDSQGSYSFNAVQVSTGTSLLKAGSPLSFAEIAGPNNSATISSVSSTAVTLAQPVVISPDNVASAPAATFSQNQNGQTVVSASGYSLSNDGKTVFLNEASSGALDNLRSKLALNGQLFLANSNATITAVNYGDGGKITSVTLDAPLSGSGALDAIGITKFTAKQFAVNSNTVTVTGDLSGFEAGMSLFDKNGNLLTTVTGVDSTGKVLTVANGAAVASVNEFVAKKSPVLVNNVAGVSKIKLPYAKSDFAPGATVYVPGTSYIATVVSNIDGVLTLTGAIPSDVVSILDKGDSINLTVKNVLSASGTTLQVRDNGQNFQAGMVLEGAGIEPGTTISSVTRSGSTLIITLSAAVDSTASITQVMAKSPLTKGGSMNGLTASSTGTNGRNGFSATSVTAFFQGGEGGAGTRGYSGGNAVAGGTGGNGGNGGSGSNGLAFNPQALAELSDSVADFVEAVGELAGSIAPDGFPPTPDYADIPAAVITVAAKSTKMATAIFDVVQWGIELNRGTRGLGGDGGDGGAGGNGSEFFGGGAGGAGGAGGDGALSQSDGGSGGAGGAGGAGGFGAGGGSGGAGGQAGANGSADPGDPGDGGRGGFGAGEGSNGDGMYGGGGSGFGGAIFVRRGGSLTITGNSLFENNRVLAGSSNNDGSAGEAAGSDLFMMKDSNVLLSPGVGKTITFRGQIADDSAASYGGAPFASGSGATIRIGGGGLVQFEGTNTYTGLTQIEGATLQADLGVGVHDDSRIHFAGASGTLGARAVNSSLASLTPDVNAGTLLTGGTIVRRVGTRAGEVSWAGAGGFSATSENLRLNFGAIGDQQGQVLRWNATGITNDSTMVFGSAYSEGYVALANSIDMNGQTGRVVVYGGPGEDGTYDNKDMAIFAGRLFNGGLEVGAEGYNGLLSLLSNQSALTSLTVRSGKVSTQGLTAATPGRLMSSSLGGSLTMTGGILETWGSERFTTMNLSNGAEMVAVGELNATSSITNSGKLSVRGGANISSLLNTASGQLAVLSNVSATGNLLNQAMASPSSPLLGVQQNANLSALNVVNDGTWSVYGARSLNVGSVAGGGRFHLVSEGSGESAVRAQLTINQAGTSTLAGSIVEHGGAGSVVKAGAGTLRVSGEHSFTGGLNVTGGIFETLGVDGRNNTLADTLAITIANGARFIAGNADEVGSFRVQGGGRLTVNASQVANAVEGVHIDSNGRMDLNANLASTTLTNNGRIAVTADRNVLLTNGLTGAGILETPATLVLNQAGNTTYTGEISGGADSTVEKQGEGVLTLSGVDASMAVRNLNIFRGAVAVDGAGILDEDLNVYVDRNTLANTVGTLRVINGDQSITSLNGSGAIDLQNRVRLSVRNGGQFDGVVTGNGFLDVEGGNFLVTAPITSSEGNFQVNSDARTDVVSTLTFPSVTVAQGGRLHLGNGASVDGRVVATTTDVFGDLTGSGSISGKTTMKAGSKLAPGNSPGVITLTDLVLDTGSQADMEIENAGGPGVGHDQIQAESMTISPGATLNILNSTNFELTPGSAVRIFNIPAGRVTGQFGTVTSQFADTVAFNIATGSVIGLGANGYAALDGLATTGNQQAMLSQLMVNDNGGVRQYYGGRLVERLAAAAAAGASTDTVFALASPEAYSGLLDYTRQSAFDALPSVPVFAKASERNMSVQFLNREHNGPHQAGYVSSKQRSNALQIQADVQHNRSTMSFSLAVDNGSLSGGYTSGSANGLLMNAAVNYPLSVMQGFSLLGRLGLSHHSTDLRRTVASGASTANVDSTTSVFGGGLRYVTDIGSLKFDTAFELLSFNSKVSQFTENNAQDVLDALKVHAQSDSGTSRRLSLGLSGRVAEGVSLRGDLVHTAFGGKGLNTVRSNVASESTTFAVSNPGLDRSQTSVGLNLSFDLRKTSTLGVGVRSQGSSGQRVSLTYQQAF